MANGASEQRDKNKSPKYKEGDTFEGHATISINCGPRLPVARIRIISVFETSDACAKKYATRSCYGQKTLYLTQAQ